MFFFFNDTATTEIYTLSLHDALPISVRLSTQGIVRTSSQSSRASERRRKKLISRRQRSVKSIRLRDRKSTRLNSSHLVISYAVFCLKKKKPQRQQAERHRGDPTL